MWRVGGGPSVPPLSVHGQEGHNAGMHLGEEWMSQWAGRLLENQTGIGMSLTRNSNRKKTNNLGLTAKEISSHPSETEKLF